MNRALVTGGAGFIGSRLVERLVERGYAVRVLDNLKRGTRPPADHTDFVEGDIRCPQAVRHASDDCDVVYHLAAQSNVMGALEDPEYSFSTNVYGTFNVLKAAVDAGVGRVVFASSREVYGEALSTPVSEDHPLEAKNPYGASKLAGEAYCRTFAHCHGIDVGILRLANTYGPGDEGRVIPLWLAEAAAGRDLCVFGGSQVLDFVWIGTVIDALVVAGERGIDAPTNIGSGAGTPIGELARRIIEITGARSQVIHAPARDAEVTRFIADVSRMRAIGIEPDADPLAHLAELVPGPAAMVT